MPKSELIQQLMIAFMQRWFQTLEMSTEPFRNAEKALVSLKVTWVNFTKHQFVCASNLHLFPDIDPSLCLPDNFATRNLHPHMMHLKKVSDVFSNLIKKK